MNTDIRIAVSFKGHRKRKRLKMMLGPGSTDYLIDLWISTAMNHPDGRLVGMDEIDIALESGWDGDPQQFVDAMLKCCFLDRCDDGYCLHDWEDHQLYAMHAEERKERARNAAARRWGKKRNAGSMPEAMPNNAGSMPEAMPLPSPTPSPIPSPSPKEIKDSCPEVHPGPSEPSPIDEPCNQVVMTIPLNIRGEEFMVLEADIAQWEETFPAIDVLEELRKCRQWSIDHPKRRKTKAGIRGHISTWLGKEQDRAKVTMANGSSVVSKIDGKNKTKPTTYGQELAQQRNDGARRLKEKFGIGGSNNEGQSDIPGSRQGHDGNLEPGAPRGTALSRLP